MRPSGQPVGSNFQRTAPQQSYLPPPQVAPRYQISPQFGTVTTPAQLQPLTCDQFLAMSPATALARTDRVSFYYQIENCLQYVAPRNKIADLAVHAPNITSDGYRLQRNGIDWLYAYVAYKLITSTGCANWNYLARINAQAPAVQQYCVQFGIGSLSAAEIANVMRIASYICGRLGPAGMAMPAGMATRPAGQADSGFSIVPALVIAGFIGALGFFAYVNEEERKANRAKHYHGGQWT